LARNIMWHNKSYIFFKEFTKKDKQAGPKGALDVVLTPGRSLAVDQRYHNLGLPIYVVAPTLRHHGENGFRRLMVAQDVGAAIKGPERGDIYWGSGDKAGAIAGRTKVQGQYIVLLPKRTK
ncbi:MAG: 3D domain-containing protein, partial [Methyloligellaceae bacterium]